MSAPSLARDMLSDIAEIICSPLMSDDQKRDAIRIAYELGRSDGRVEGAKSMGEHMTKSIDLAFTTKVAP